MRALDRIPLITAALIALTAGCNCGDTGLYTVAPAIVASPTPMVFGAVEERTTLVLEVRNVGTGPLIVSDASLTDGTDPRFSLNGDVATIDVEDTLRFEVSFDAIGTGEANGVIRLASNDPEQHELLVPVSARVPLVVGRPALRVSPEVIDFGTVPVGEQRAASIAIDNAGDAPLTIGSARLVDGSADIALAPELFGHTLGPGERASVEVTFVPATAGEQRRTLRILSNDPVAPTVEVPIIGRGAGDARCGGIAGRICDLSGQGAAVGATVSVVAAGERHEATTDATGDWSMTCVPEGTWTFTAASASWNTTFTAGVVGDQHTQLETPECLDPTSARVAVVWGEWDAIEDVLDAVNVPYTLYQNGAELVNDPATLANYDIVFFNCGWDEAIGLRSPGLDNIRDFVANGGSIYTSDLGYDLVEVGWPSFVDFDGDDNIRDDAEWSEPFFGTANVVDAALQTALGASSIEIESPGAAMERASGQTRVYLSGDRFGDGGTHPMMISFRPSPSAGLVFYSDFHNEGQARVQALFEWLIQNL